MSNAIDTAFRNERLPFLLSSIFFSRWEIEVLRASMFNLNSANQYGRFSNAALMIRSILHVSFLRGPILTKIGYDPGATLQIDCTSLPEWVRVSLFPESVRWHPPIASRLLLQGHVGNVLSLRISANLLKILNMIQQIIAGSPKYPTPKQKAPEISLELFV